MPSMTSNQLAGAAAQSASGAIVDHETVAVLRCQHSEDQPLEEAKHQLQTTATDFISFVDVADEVSQLSASTGDAQDTNCIPPPLDTPALSRSSTNNTARSASFGSVTGNIINNATSSSTLTHTPSPTQPHCQAPTSAIRKTSPGLAARLKALGFGTSKKQYPTPQHHIGRLDEQQLRQLDENHQANSTSSTVSRRGRPWKGASAFTTAQITANDQPVVATDLPQLPEVKTSEPLAMDTQKYRLPDHTNGNGTKVTLDTRREHIERTTRPPSPDATPPPPPRKDTPPPPSTPPNVASPSDYVPGLGSYFTPGRNRPGSIYTLSRVSFASQLAQLTSLQLPDAESLSSKVSAIPTAQVATKALINASDQIRSWISKAQEVISGLDSDDDVEWAAAGGREGLNEVESAITRFEDLIHAYIGAIEELQTRDDITQVPAEDLKRAVSQMEAIIEEWARIRATLQSVRVQVEIAMEWEELWNNVLGDIQGEMDELIRLVFEMEERRHKSVAAAAAAGDNVDIGDLENIVEDTPPPAARLKAANRFSLALPMSPNSPGTPGLSQDDSSLLALFARMQPLRASLDFLPMRLSSFEARAEKMFPTACEELDMRRTGLDASYKKLEKDAESLRKELGEDRWVIVFRGAGRQAQKMHESVQRSLFKLGEAIDSEVHLPSPPTMMKKIENYEAKKTHYGPAIERVLSIIDKGVKDRLTVNGEILRLHSDTQTRWETLKAQMREMDAIIDDVQADRRSQQLRDSVSSMLSTVGSGRDTPGSSPPSSVIMSSLGFEPHTPLPKSKGWSPSGNTHTHLPQSTGRRHSSLPAPSYPSNRRTGSRLSTIASSSAATPVKNAKPVALPPGSTATNRPVWNSSTNTTDIDTGHHFKPLNLTTPSPYAKTTPPTRRSASALTPSSGSKLPTLRSTFTRAASESPKVDETPSRGGHSRLSFRDRIASPGPYSQQLLSTPRLNSKSSFSALASNRRVTLQPSGSNPAVEDHVTRPASSMASGRRTSFLPHFKGRTEGTTGRSTPHSLPGSGPNGGRKSVAESRDSKPRWRH